MTIFDLEGMNFDARMKVATWIDSISPSNTKFCVQVIKGRESHHFNITNFYNKNIQNDVNYCINEITKINRGENIVFINKYSYKIFFNNVKSSNQFNKIAIKFTDNINKIYIKTSKHGELFERLLNDYYAKNKQ